jgi:Xaa-Pro aminopeptidase
MVDSKIYISRIQSVQKQLKSGGILVLFAASHVTRNRDVEYKFRQDSDFYYLTGINEPDSILVLTEDHSVMFCLPKDKDAEIWTGIRLGKNKIKKQLNLNETYDLSEWKKEFPKLILNKDTLYHFFGINSSRDQYLLKTCHEISQKVRDGKFAPERIIQPYFIHEMRLKKSKEEIIILEESARITAIGHIRLMRESLPGMREYQLEAILEDSYLSEGSWGGGYGHIVASGKNACILHYVENNAVLKKGDLVLVDSGAEKNYYTADVTRCFPVDLKFTPAQSHIYSLVLAAQKNAIRMCVAGKPFYDIHDATVRFFSECLKDLDLLKGSVDKIIEKGDYKKFYMHRIGHFLGMDVHDVGKYYLAGEKRKLSEGMVVTIEPGLYFDPTDKTIPEEFRGIGIRIEDDILVTKSNPINLTEMIPKEIEDIEAIRANSK